MIDAIRLDVACYVPVTFVPPRCRKVRIAFVPHMVPIAVPVIDPAEAPVVFAARSVHGRHERRMHSGDMLRPMSRNFPTGGGYDNWVRTPAFEELLSSQWGTSGSLMLGRRPWPFEAMDVEGGPVITRMIDEGSRIVSDDHDRVEREILGAASHLRIIDGVVHGIGAVPAVTAGYDLFDRMSRNVHDNAIDWGRPEGHAFCIDREDAMRELMGLHETYAGYEESNIRIDMAVGDALGFDESSFNAAYAVDEVLKACGPHIHDLPGEGMGLLHRLATLREGLESTPGNCDGIAESLGDITRSGAKGFLFKTIHAAAGIGIDATRLSMREVRSGPVLLPDSDAAALGGLTHH